jgi:hypothetical protein
MTRAAVFLAAILVAASLGVVAQDNHSTTGSGPAAASSVQSSSSQQAGDVNAGSQSQRESSDVADQSGVPDGRTENGQLPQTSTMLPLLGLIGLGSLVAGFFARR